MKINFHPASPILRVEDLSKSIEYYQNSLGFAIDWNYEGVMSSISRGEANLMICQGDQGLGKAWVYIGVGDVEKLHEEFVKNKAKVRQEPTNFPWAIEIQVEDLDGNIIRFGSESKENTPFGAWMDMNGKLWN